MNEQKTDGLWAFFGLTYVMMLLTWGVLALFGMSVASTTNTEGSTSALAMTLYMIGGFTPSIAGFIMAHRMAGRAGTRDLWKRFMQFNLGAKWYAIIFAVPFLVQAGVALVYKLQGGSFMRPTLLDQPVMLLPLIISIFIGGPFSEEFGWRGFAQDRVQARWGFVKGNIILGLIWAFWHLPLFFVQGAGQQRTGNPTLVFPVYVVWVIAMVFFFSWIYANTDRSLWGAVLFHFAMNFGGVLLIEVADVSEQFMYMANSSVWVVLVVLFYFLLMRNDEKLKN